MKESDTQPEWLTGAFNVEKCVAYLRGIGVELEDAQVQSWSDTEQVRRWLKSERRAKRTCWRMTCRQGHAWSAVWRGRAVPKGDSTLCPTCGGGAVFYGGIWSEARDGTVADNRPASERWKPLEGL